MRNSSKAEDSASEGSSSSASRKPTLQIVSTRDCAPKSSIADQELLSYIEEMALELRVMSADAHQDMLAFLFECAAQEARRQSRAGKQR